jgi:hypothetical protein
MKRALLVICALTSPAAAQVGPYVNPFNPYASSASVGTIYSRPYISLDRLNIRYQSQMVPSGYGAMDGTTWNAANPTLTAATFRHYPNYPMLSSSSISARTSGNPSAKSLQPLPMSIGPPDETACDPYQDYDGCVSKYADSPSELANAIRQTIHLRSPPQISSPIASPR